jgi:hypothetical protein
VADQDRRLVERLDLGLVVVDDLDQPETLEVVGRLTEVLDVASFARPLRCGDGVTSMLEVVGEVLPAPRRKPCAVNEHHRRPVG